MNTYALSHNVQKSTSPARASSVTQKSVTPSDRIGDFRALECEKLLGFLRTTEKPLESTIVLANPTDAPITETFVVPDPTLMGYTLMRDGLSNTELRVQAGTFRPTVPPRTVMIFSIDGEAIDRGQYKRMKDGD